MTINLYIFLLGFVTALLLVGLILLWPTKWFFWRRRKCSWNDKPPEDDKAHKGLVNSTSRILSSNIIPSDEEIEKQLEIYKKKFPLIYHDVTVEKVKRWYKEDLGISPERADGDFRICQRAFPCRYLDARQCARDSMLGSECPKVCNCKCHHSHEEFVKAYKKAESEKKI